MSSITEAFKKLHYRRYTTLADLCRTDDAGQVETYFQKNHSEELLQATIRIALSASAYAVLTYLIEEVPARYGYIPRIDEARLLPMGKISTMYFDELIGFEEALTILRDSGVPHSEWKTSLASARKSSSRKI